MNRQFIWVVCGILVIHIVAISALMQSSAERRREQSRASLPSAQEMGTVAIHSASESLTKPEVEEPAISEALFEEDVALAAAEEATAVMITEKPLAPVYTSEKAVLPEPAPLVAEQAATLRLEAELSAKIADPSFTVPDPVVQQAEPAPTNNPVTIVQVNAQSGKIERQPSALRGSQTTAPIVVAQPVQVKENRSAFLKPMLPPRERSASSPPAPVLRETAQAPVGLRSVAPINRSELPRIRLGQ